MIHWDTDVDKYPVDPPHTSSPDEERDIRGSWKVDKPLEGGLRIELWRSLISEDCALSTKLSEDTDTGVCPIF